MDLANCALIEGDLGTAQTPLRRYWPGPRETDLHNWEWRYLANLSDGDPHFSLVAHIGEVLSLGFLDDNVLMTGGAADWRTILWNLKERRPFITITNRGFGGGLSSVMVLAPARNALFYRAGWSGATRVCVVDLQNGIELQGGREGEVLPESGSRSSPWISRLSNRRSRWLTASKWAFGIWIKRSG
jgi:WD40 repeat protein